MKNLSVLGIVGLLGTIIGCVGPEVTPTTPVTNKNDLQNLMEGEERIIFQRPESSPCWLEEPECYTNKKPGNLYFVGIGIPNEDEQKSSNEALNHGSREVADYLFKLVDEQEYISDSLRNSVGYVPVQTLARDTLGAQIRKSAIKYKYGVASFTQRKVKKQYGALQYFWMCYRLFEFSRSGLSNAMTETQNIIQESYEKERDTVKRELLKKNEEMLNEIKKKFSAE